MEIRKVTIGDLEQMTSILIEFKESLNEYEPSDMMEFRQIENSHEVINEFVKSEILNPDGDFFIAVENNDIVGFAYGTIENYKHMVYKPVKRGILQHIWVNSGHRGKGIARELKNALEAWMKSHDCKYVKLGVLNSNPACEIYKKWGFENLLETMVKKF